MLKYDDEILVKQIGILNGIKHEGKGKLLENRGVNFILMLHDPTEEESPFEDFLDTQSRFSAIIEIEEDGIQKVFELTLLPTSSIFDEFEVIEDNKYILFKQFLMKREAEKLEKELSIKSEIKNFKNKI